MWGFFLAKISFDEFKLGHLNWFQKCLHFANFHVSHVLLWLNKIKKTALKTFEYVIYYVIDIYISFLV